MKIQILKNSQIPQLTKMIRQTCRKSFKLFYPKEWIATTISRQTTKRIREKAKTMHFYVAVHNNQILGCAAIGQTSADTSGIYSFFIKTEYQGKGIGTKLLKALQKDEFWLNAQSIEVSSSLNAIPFYVKNGFTHKNGKVLVEYGSVYLEKFKE